MVGILGKFMRSVRARGVVATLILAKDRMIGGNSFPQALGRTPDGKIDIIGFYNNIIGHPHGDAADLGSTAPDQLQWVIPNLGSGSGGHQTIFRFINMLSKRGYKQHVVILPPYSWTNAKAAHAAIENWYFPLEATLSLGIEGFRPAAVTFATGWQTAYWVSKHRASAEKLYFVQDFEPSFSPISSDYFFSENTYRLGLKGITAGSWLSEKLSAEYGMQCVPISFGIDKAYVPREQPPKDDFNIVFYSRHVTPRRLFEMGLLALDRVCKEEPSVVVTFIGGDVGHINIPFRHVNLGQQSIASLPELYAQSNLALVLSGTNLSLVPLEVAACGCPVVMNDSPSSRWLLPDDAAFYAAPDPDSLAKAMLDVIRDKKETLARTERALAIAQAATWEQQADRLIEGINTLTGRGKAK